MSRLSFKSVVINRLYIAFNIDKQILEQVIGISPCRSTTRDILLPGTELCRLSEPDKVSSSAIPSYVRESIRPSLDQWTPKPEDKEKILNSIKHLNKLDKTMQSLGYEKQPVSTEKIGIEYKYKNNETHTIIKFVNHDSTKTLYMMAKDSNNYSLVKTYFQTDTSAVQDIISNAGLFSESAKKFDKSTVKHPTYQELANSYIDKLKSDDSTDFYKLMSAYALVDNVNKVHEIKIKDTTYICYTVGDTDKLVKLEGKVYLVGVYQKRSMMSMFNSFPKVSKPELYTSIDTIVNIENGEILTSVDTFNKLDTKLNILSTDTKIEFTPPSSYLFTEEDSDHDTTSI